ncbi:calcium-binding protein [Natrinema sp. DC36]|uniref:calcium-binding protein n=1 Tax=Natrinema sp. DC36 TaxID=2878680 RepID=UPI001CF01C96|nr:calcium-binding protein [Natrinema sp. DC36]
MTGKTDDSTRSIAKRGTIAATALALGTGVTAGTATAQDDEEIVLFGDDYLAGVNFDVVSELEGQTVSNVLQSATDGASQTTFETPDDWDGYIIQYDSGEDAAILGLLFTEDADLSAGDSGSMSEEASFRNSALSLVETDLD